MNYRLVLRLLGFVTLLVAASMLVCLPWAWLDGDRASLLAFTLSPLAAALVGGLLLWAGRRVPRDILGRREGLLVVVGSWVLAGGLGALPFLMSGTIQHVVDAVFESISGFTTTGASVLTDIEAIPRAVLFWRSLIQWLGGMGIIVLFVAVLPGLGIGGRFLYRQEVPGPSKAGLLPHVRDTASLLWKIYVGFAVVQVILLSTAGLDLFEALCHTFTTMATSGYSTRNASIGGFDNIWVELIIILFMLAAGVNFSLYASLGRRRQRTRSGGWQTLRATLMEPELRLYLSIILVATLLLSGSLVLQAGQSPLTALRQAGFQAVSIQTTTGFVTADFDAWPGFCRLLLVALMFVGSCAGSTGGSIKVVRYLVMARVAWAQVRRFFRPRRISTVRVGHTVVDGNMQRAIAGFFVLFLSTWIVVALALAALGSDLVTAASASIACVGNIGPGLGAVGATQNYFGLPPASKLILCAAMIIGRLEVYTVLALLSRSFWRP